ncbi:hypothetical protein BR93DRAFT_13825 [Coniochaeta sp. PMI_546]|nr:hypothetical protein BR93DRAFT_13825 [Coniochaeta sp. PMI_546]
MVFLSQTRAAVIDIIGTLNNDINVTRPVHMALRQVVDSFPRPGLIPDPLSRDTARRHSWLHRTDACIYPSSSSIHSSHSERYQNLLRAFSQTPRTNFRLIIYQLRGQQALEGDEIFNSPRMRAPKTCNQTQILTETATESQVNQRLAHEKTARICQLTTCLCPTRHMHRSRIHVHLQERYHTERFKTEIPQCVEYPRGFWCRTLDTRGQ